MPLPSQVSITVGYDFTPPYQSYFDVTFVGSQIFGSNLYLGWCADRDTAFSPININLTAMVFPVDQHLDFSALESLYPDAETPNWTQYLDEVHWLLNQNYIGQPAPVSSYTMGDVQGAIWTLLGDTPAGSNSLGTWNQANVDQLVAEAVTHNGYIPDFTDGDFTDDNMLVLLAPKTNNGPLEQPIIVLFQLAALGDRLWVDTNGDGIQNDGATGISGQTVTLIGGGADGLISTTGDNTTVNTITGPDGFYQFAGLMPGVEYQIQFSKPAGTVFTTQDAGGNTLDATDSDVDASGLSQIVILSTGEYNPTIDAGVYTPGSIGDKVWLDCNNNGIQDNDEAGVAGVKVHLLDSNGNEIATATTGAQGNYLFSNLRPGEYAIKVDKPVGYAFTTQDAGVSGATDANDSDVNAATGQSNFVTLTSGQNNLTVDAGLIGDPVCVRYDFSGSSSTSGAYGNSRTYELSGVSVTATAWSRVQNNTDTWAAAYLGAYGGGLGVTDTSESGSGNSHTVDNVGGRDNYVVFQFSQDVIVDKAYLGYVVCDSDISVWIGSSATPVTTVNDAFLASMTLYEENWTGSSSARWADFNDGKVSGNVLIIAANTSDGSPEDQFKIEKLDICTAVPCKASIGDRVWLDANSNGIQDAGEAGVSGVTVKLLSASGAVLGTTTTNGSGEYLFSGLTPGYYGVEVVAPTGFGFTKKDQGPDDGKDSDVDSSGKTVVTTLSAGENDLSWDAGLVPASVCITYDFSGSSSTDGCDGNSRSYTQAGVTVKATAWSRDQSSGKWAEAYLGAYGGGHGVTDSSEGSGSGDRHTVDNMGGRDNYVVYQFSKDVVVDKAYLGYVVCDSDISVWIGSSATPITKVTDALLSGMTYEENWTSSSSARWADFNAGNVSGNVLIIAANTSDTSPEDRFKIQKLDICTTPGADQDVQKALLGGKVWCDTNGNGLQDAGEAAVAGVTVKLLDGNNLLKGTTTTNSSGNYSFANLNPGDYKLQFVKPDAYGGFTVANVDDDGNDMLDSDASSSGMTGLTTLAAGESDTSLDAGLTPPRVNLCYDFSGSSATSGTYGNVRSYTVGGVEVTATAVSRYVDKGTAKWETAWLGAYGGGHGVTDRSEGNGSNSTHTVDNVGRINYVIYQFSEKVVVDKAYLGYVIGDSDITTWIGSSTSKLTNLSDSLLNDMVKEDNNTTSSSARWADFNNGAQAAEGNVLVIAASTWDSTPDDYFKIEKLVVSAASKTVTPIAIDLDGNGIQTTSLADAQGQFDLFGNGSAVKSGWLSAGDAFLAFDADGNGRIDDISELFGGSKQGDGFARLAAFDSNGDGLVDAADDGYVNLSVWRDANGNHQTDPGELISLADAGVVSVNVAYHEDAFWDVNGNLHLEQSSATLANGNVVDMTDIYFSVAANDGAAVAEAPVSDPGWLFA